MDGGSGLLRLTSRQLMAVTDQLSNPAHEFGYAKTYSGRLHGTKVKVTQLTESEGLASHEAAWEKLSDLGRLRHPHVVSLVACCAEERCIVTEAMEGGTLQHVLDELSVSKKGKMEWPARFRIALEISSGLLHMHLKNILHGDLKPSNVFLDLAGYSKVANAGLIKLAGPDMAATAGYRDPSGGKGRQADVYALGLIILQLLTGKPKIEDLLTLVVEAERSTNLHGNRKAMLERLLTRIGDRDQLTDEILKCKQLIDSRWKDGLDSALDIFLGKLDTTAGQWPPCTRDILKVALRCVEKVRKLRPNLESEVVAEIERVIGSTAGPSANSESNLARLLSYRFLKDRSSNIFGHATTPLVVLDGSLFKAGAIGPRREVVVEDSRDVTQSGLLFLNRGTAESHLWVECTFKLCSKSGQLRYYTGRKTVPEICWTLKNGQVPVKSLKEAFTLGETNYFDFTISFESLESIQLAGESDSVDKWIQSIKDAIDHLESKASKVRKAKTSRPTVRRSLDIQNVGNGQPSSIAVDEKGVLWMSRGKKLHCWIDDTPTTPLGDNDSDSAIQVVAIDSSQRLWTGSEQGEVEVREWSPTRRNLLSLGKANVGHRINALICTREGEVWLAYGNVVSVWHLTALPDRKVEYLGKFEVHKGQVESLAAGPNGLVCSASRDGSVIAWRENGYVTKVEVTKEEVNRSVVGLAFGPDGTLWAGLERGWILSISKDWEVKEEIKSDLGMVRGTLQVAANGVLWTGHRDNSIKGWRNGRSVFTLMEHDDKILSLFARENGNVWSLGADNCIMEREVVQP